MSLAEYTAAHIHSQNGHGFYRDILRRALLTGLLTETAAWMLMLQTSLNGISN